MAMEDTAPAATAIHKRPHADDDADDALDATPRKTLAYLDDDGLDDDGDDVVSELTMNQFPRASRYDSGGYGGGGAMRMSSILKLPTMRLRGPTIYGWLWKKGASFKTWKKRFFLLNGATLTYYTQACVVATEVGTRCFEMPAKGGLRVASAEISDLTQFGLCVTSSSGRVLHLQAGDRAARIKWLGVLLEAAKKSSAESLIRATRVSDVAPFKPSSHGSVSSTASGGSGGFADTGSSDASIQSSSMSSTRSSEDDDGDDADVGPTDMSGWLQVRRRTPAMFNIYKKRFVTLVDGHLTLTSHARERRPLDKSLEVISATTWHGHEHGLKLQLEKHKHLYVYASTGDEAKRWLQAVRNNF